MFWSGEIGQKRGAIFRKKLYYWKSNIYPFYSLTTKVNIFVYFVNDWFSIQFASFFEKWKGGCAFGYGFHTHCRPLKMGIVFFCGLFWACWRLFDAKDDTIIVFCWKMAVRACFGLGRAVFHKEWIRKNRKRTWLMKKVLLLRCPSQGEGVSGRVWAGFRSAPCVFFVFGCIKNRKRRFWFPGPGLIFWKRFFGKDAENHVFATIAANFIDFCS